MMAVARHGQVMFTGQLPKEGALLTREQAAELLVSIASAIHMSGDISDPAGVNLHEDVRRAVASFKREG